MNKWLIPFLCALPFIGIALWFFSGKNPGNFLTLGLVLACPLTHVFLMKHDDHKDHNKHK